jgi:short-subunit dehydrogenase
MAVYYASKAYVLSFSEALHRELSERGVRVTTLCPGPVPTEFQARAGGMQDNAAVRALELSAERVAQIGYEAFMAGQRVAIAGIGNRIAVSLMRLVPNALLLRLADQRPRSARGGK